MEMNLARNGLTPAGHMYFYNLIGQAGTDGDRLQLSSYTET